MQPEQRNGLLKFELPAIHITSSLFIYNLLRIRKHELNLLFVMILMITNK